MVKKISSKKQVRRASSGIFSTFSQNQLSEFKQAFEFIDFNKDGFIDRRDVVAAFDSLGRQYPDNEIDQMIAEGHGQINFAMFITLIGEKIMGHDSVEELCEALSKFDKYENGKVDRCYLLHCLKTYGDKLSEEEMQDILQSTNLGKEADFEISQFVQSICGTEDE